MVVDPLVRTGVWELTEGTVVNSQPVLLDSTVDSSTTSVACVLSNETIVCPEPVLRGKTVDPSDRTVVCEVSRGMVVLEGVLRGVVGP